MWIKTIKLLKTAADISKATHKIIWNKLHNIDVCVGVEDCKYFSSNWSEGNNE